MSNANNIIYVGVNDYKIDLFEGLYSVKNGVSYNSYIIFDKKIAIMDTVDTKFTKQWLKNIADALNGKTPDYLIIQHMEPDHSASIVKFMEAYPYAKIVSSAKSFEMMKNFFGINYSERRIPVADGDCLCLGEHNLKFLSAPMVHWPEVIVTYDLHDKVLFSADSFGKFGASDVQENWIDEARRYYIGIVGKYGKQVQLLLQKVSKLEIKMICPLHGPILNSNLDYYLNLYNIWSSYRAETDGIFIAYTSVYGNTKKAIELLEQSLKKNNCPKVATFDLARCDMSEAIANAFRYKKNIFATTTYNADIFPFMKSFINSLLERNYQNRHVAFIENGSWAPSAIKIMKSMFENSKNITFANSNVTLHSSINDKSLMQINNLSKELCSDY